MNELYPLKVFEHWMRYWWLPVIACLLGGLCGYAIHLSHPPVYEATATFYAALDLNKIAPLDLTENEEDLALEQMSAALFSAQTIQALQKATAGQGLNIDYSRLYTDATVERQHAFWNVRYRSGDPRLSQAFVNTWVEVGYTTIQTWQKSGLIKPYIIIDPPTPAPLPQQPVNYEQSRLILAGSLVGFIIGLAASGLLGKKIDLRTATSPQQAENLL